VNREKRGRERGYAFSLHIEYLTMRQDGEYT
jgi:hypothetical protein